MSSGSAQDVAVEHFLRDIEGRSQRFHCAVIGCEEEHSSGSNMNLLYRKSRMDWRQRDQESSKKSSSQKDPSSSATVGKVRDLASFRRHFRMGFMTMPASQDLSPHSCASAMAPRSQSCHAVGAGDTGLENGDYSDTQSQHGGRCPPTKPKRHPSTRLSSSSSDHRGSLGGATEALPPLLSSHPQAKHSDKKNAMKKSDSGEMGGKKVPPLKPKRSPSTQLSLDPQPLRTAPPATPLPFQQAAEGTAPPRGGDDEPVYIEMVGQVFTRESQTATPHPVTPVATTPDSDSDQSEAIYEEMKYPQPDNRDPHKRLPPKHDRGKSGKHYHASAASSSSSASPLPRPSSSSPSCSKPKATVSISHSSPLPSSTSSTPVPQALSASPHPPRAPTPYLLQGGKSEAESNTKIPAPFPNLLQHRPPLLAFPQPAAASSGVGVQHKAASAGKLGTISVQGSSSHTAPSGSSSCSTTPSSSTPVPLSKDFSGGSGAQQDKQSRDAQLGPAPGLRARSHSTPLPPSSKSTSPYSHHHHHPHHRPSHYHHYRKPERGDSPAPGKSSQGSGQSTAQTQTQGSGKEGKSVSFCLKSDKGERDRDRERDRDKDRDREKDRDRDRDRERDRDRDRDRERERDRDRDGGTENIPPATSSGHSSQGSTSSTPTPSSSSSSQRPHSRPHLHRSHHAHQGLPAYKPPSSDSPLLWTYPSVGFRRPPAYDSLRGGSQLPSLHHGGGDGSSKSGAPCQGTSGFMPWDGSGLADEGHYWPMHRKLSFSHGSRETEKKEGRSWNGSADALLKMDKDESGGNPPRGGGHSGIPRFSGRGLHSESLAGMEGGSPGFRALPRTGLPLPCQTFPACRNGELGRLGRSSSTSGVRQVGGGDVQRQSILPAREALNQLHGLSQLQASPCSPGVSRQQQQLQLHQQQLQQQLQLQLQQQHHLQLQFQHLAQLAQGQPPATGGAVSSAAQTQRDGKLMEVIERKRCLCKEIKAHRRPDKSLCKQDSMPILPSWRRTPEPRKTGTPPCQRPQAVVWDTAI